MTPRIRPARPSTTRWLAVSALLVAALVGACGDDDDDGAAAPDDQTTAPVDDGTTEPADEEAAGAAAVIASGFAFSTNPVAAGAEVTFANDDSAPHTMTADDGEFDTGTVAAGESATITAPADPGDYAFHCEIHSSMQATLTVEG